MPRNLYIRQLIHGFLLINGLCSNNVSNSAVFVSCEDTSITNPPIIDSLSSSKPSEGALGAKVNYGALDSMRFDVANQKVYLFGDAELLYEGIELNVWVLFLLSVSIFIILSINFKKKFYQKNNKKIKKK